MTEGMHFSAGEQLFVIEVMKMFNKVSVPFSGTITKLLLPDGDSLVVTTPHPAHATAIKFSPSAIEAAVRQSQRNEHTYLDFIRKTMAAGCVGYFVQIAGRRVIYFGRNGESHVEHFPPTP